MSLGGPSGAGGAPPPQIPAGTAALRQLAQSGWIEGRVTSVLAEGGARIATMLGLVVAPEAGAGLMPGDRVRLRMNPQTGQIETAPPQGGAQQGAQPGGGGAPPGPSLLLRPLAEVLPPHLPSAALASLSPILPGAGGALGTATPPPGSALYGLIAALFPGEARARGPGAARTRRRGTGTAASEAETPDEAPAVPLAAEPPAPARRDPLDIIDWGLPEAEAEEDGAPTAGAEPPADAAAVPAPIPPDRAGQIARMSGHLPEGGEVHLDARRQGDHITLDVTSDRPLPAEIARLIRGQAEALARAWGARLSCSFRHGAAPQAG